MENSYYKKLTKQKISLNNVNRSVTNQAVMQQIINKLLLSKIYKVLAKIKNIKKVLLNMTKFVIFKGGK